MTLYRVADIAQKLFLLHRELIWGQFDVQKVEKSGGNLFLRGTASAILEAILESMPHSYQFDLLKLNNADIS
jgi:hypothetical protein